jgi:hypothetical protein
LNWEETLIPVECVIAYWSRVLALAETRYSATECEALAAKESLVCFQPFIEGERILLVTDHSALIWVKMYENTNRRLAAWGLVFAAFPEMVIVHRPGRVHSNVDLLSRLPRIPTFISPARDDLPSESLSTEYKDLQTAWENFIKEQELAVESKVIGTRLKRQASKEDAPCSQVPQPSTEADLSSNATTKDPSENRASLHVFADEDTIQRFADSYSNDKDFSTLLNRMSMEGSDETKFRMYHIGTNGLLYFKDADQRICLCVPNTEREAIIKEIHDEAHKGAHASWECTLASMPPCATDSTGQVCGKTLSDTSAPVTPARRSNTTEELELVSSNLLRSLQYPLTQS